MTAKTFHQTFRFPAATAQQIIESLQRIPILEYRILKSAAQNYDIQVRLASVGKNPVIHVAGYEEEFSSIKPATRAVKQQIDTVAPYDYEGTGLR